MLKIGEKLNSSIPRTLAAMKERDDETLLQLIRDQEAGGAAYLDINTALVGETEAEELRRIVSMALRESGCGIMLDSPNAQVLAGTLPAAEGRPVMVNSVTLDARYDALLPLIGETGAGVVCLPMADGRIPLDPRQRVDNAEALANKLAAVGVPAEKIWIDVLAESIATSDCAARAALETIRQIKERLPEVRTLCGLSNISFGLPQRANINGIFLAMALSCGLDGAILDVNSAKVRTALLAAEAILGKDEYCLDYIDAMRNQ